LGLKDSTTSQKLHPAVSAFPCNVLLLAGPFDLVNEFFHERQLVQVLLPEVLFAKISRLLLSVFGS
jgi:hypothetical protein